MALKLMYITNRPDVAVIAENAGVDRVFVDMEYIGKAARQGGMDSVQNHHTVEDVKTVRSVLTKAQLLVRINPIHEASSEYCSSKEEISAVVAAGADLVMLPFFKTQEEVKEFISFVDGRAKTIPLVETPEATERIDEILAIPGIDEIYVGINDLSLGYGKTFMFELLADGTVEWLCQKFKRAGIPYGFGGIAGIGSGTLPAETILKEHYRLGSTRVIFSRSFCNIREDTDIEYVREKFETGVRSLRAFEREIEIHSRYFTENKADVASRVAAIVEQKRQTAISDVTEASEYVSSLGHVNL